MRKEQNLPAFEITEQLAKESLKRLVEIPEDVFIDNSLEKMRLKQPIPYGYFKRAEMFKMAAGQNTEMFRFGAAWAFDIIPQNHRGKLLTADIINSTHASIVDNVVRVDHEKGSASVSFSRFIDQIAEKSQAFLDLLADAIEVIEDPREKAEFEFGALLIVIPFFMRAQAKEMERDLLKSS